MTPLDGTLVIALEQAVAAPYCSARLADAGARVIKIERPGIGDFARHYDAVAHGLSAYFVWLNRAKESVELDLGDHGDLGLLDRMLARADVFIQNLAPGSTERFGLGAAALRDRHPRLVICEISGYGTSGPYRDRKAYDLLIQAETGLASITGTPEAPGRVGVSVCDIAAGLNALSGILLALARRARTGRGEIVRVSLFDTMAEWMAVPLLHHDYGGRAPERAGIRHPSIAPYGAYETADGQWIVIAIQNEPEWRALCTRVLGAAELADRPQFSSNIERVQHREDLEANLVAFFQARPRAELARALRGAGIAYGDLNSVADFAAHPQLRRSAVPTEAGEIALPAPPLRFDDAGEGAGGVPSLGQHNEAIRREFGAT